MLYKIAVLKSAQFKDFLTNEKIPFTMASADSEKHLKFMVPDFIKKNVKTKIADFIAKDNSGAESRI